MYYETFKAYFQLTRLDKPVGVYLILWPALWSLWLASDATPQFELILIFILGAILMRSAGCVINDYADRHFDGHVSRTCQRPIVQGLISEKQALIFFAVLCFMAFGLVLLLNPLTIILSLGAVFLAALYPFMKRHTYWPQAFLGAAFAWAIPMGFAAVNETVPASAWVVFAVTMVWALIYDTAYAIADKEDDLKIGVKSTAILFGRYVGQIVGLFQGLMLLGLIWMGQLFSLGVGYDICVVISVGFFVYHQILLSQNTPELAFKAFLNNHWVGLIILVGIIVDKSIMMN